MHAALTTALALASGSPDAVRLGVDIVCGMACVGDIPASGWWTPKETEAELSMSDLDHEAWNSSLERTVRSRGAGQS